VKENTYVPSTFCTFPSNCKKLNPTRPTINPYSDHLSNSTSHAERHIVNTTVSDREYGVSILTKILWRSETQSPLLRANLARSFA